MVADSIRELDRAEAKVDAGISLAFIELASRFANRTGGMAADLWANIPSSLAGLSGSQAIELAKATGAMLDHGGSVALNFLTAGSEVLRNEPDIFNDWRKVLPSISSQGNAVLIAFLRATPRFFKSIKGIRLDGAEEGSVRSAALRRLMRLLYDVAEADGESSLAAFRSAGTALRSVSLDQYQKWIEAGLAGADTVSAKARRSYFALETRQSNDQLKQTRSGLDLEAIRHVLRLYIEALTGREVEIAPQSAMPQEARIGDGKTIYLPNNIAEFDTEEKDFRLYKVLAAYGAGQIEFGTFVKDSVALKAAFADLSELYSATAEEIDAFSLAGYIEDVQKGQRAVSDEEIVAEVSRRRRSLPPGSDYKAVLNVFPEPRLARKIFTTMENARIDALLRRTYRGLRKDLDLMQALIRKNRPFIFDVPYHQVPFELLFQITLCGGATEDARQFYGQIVSEIETVIEKHIHGAYRTDVLPTVADSLFATSRVYNLFQNISPEQTQEAETESTDDKSEFAYDDKHADEAATEEKGSRDERPQSMQDLRDLFNAWNMDEENGEPDDIRGAESWSQNEMPELPLEPGDEAFAYDEWDRELNDYRVGWSRVIEKRVKRGDRTFVELTRSRYRGVISSIRYQFQLMKPENLTKINREIDGEDYDLGALVDLVIDRKADGRQSENIYTKRLRRQRDVAVSILLDQSSSTARTITRNPLQPYTYPGRRIIEIEKEGLVLMSEALEAVGDVYSINGFTSEGRRNVKFYVVKDFNEKYSEETEKRIGGITFQNNTRLGAAIRHAAHKLLKQENRTKLLLILTDGRPYDHDYGDARYAREDVREALIEAKINGITPFCITIDRESEAELRDLYGDVGYTIIDDILSLPERMPNIYRRLTT
ncbi:nitric oxide reductase activation protein NorD [Leptolyngbya sp. 7M]|uniref:nitric oxide reductase activation protein NorD n=1 Tax=Leptolyngbya sp. 7M TaxID=2812896 RepID=UPI001B8B37D5|nr:VWA domain-containing protein [Leptolyngbya sp. 7M]QYO65464.1 VWA domain-containing protein [Leptolyngbya sp. 7M]